MVPPGSARLVLRRVTAHDVEALVELDSDPEVMRYLSRTPPDADEVRARVAVLIDDYARHPRYGLWLAHERTTGAFVGWFALTVGPEGELDLGYRLRRSFWGQGLASETSRALVAYALADPTTVRVYAQTMAVNEPSRRVMAAAGLHHVRTFHPHFDDPLPGTDQGEVEYEIRRTADQPARRPSPSRPDR